MSKHLTYQSPELSTKALTPRIAITGATGNVGSKVVQLLSKSSCKLRLMARDRSKAQAVFGGEAEIVNGDLSDIASMRAAFEGIDTVLLVTSGPAIPEYDHLAASAARTAGVKHLVKLSSFDAQHQVGTGVWHAQGERAIRDSGVPFTFVRPSGFMSNALFWADSIKRYSVVRSCTGLGRIAFIHPTDIADLTAAILLAPDRYVGAVMPITGPEPLSYAEMAEKIGLAIGKPVGFEELSEAQTREQQASWRTAPALIEARLSIFRAIREGTLQGVTDVVRNILVRPALDFDTWARENAASFI